MRGRQEPVLVAAVATARKGEAEYWALAADMKLLHAGILRQELTGANGDDLLGAWRGLEPRIQDVLSPFMEDHSIRRAMDLWWTPTAEAAVVG